MKALYFIKIDSKDHFIFDVKNERCLFFIDNLQILYCVLFSSEYMMNKLPDVELMTFQVIFKEYFNIIFEARPTNPCKTNYRLEKLFNKTEKEFNDFIKRYPKIFEYFKNKDENKNGNDENTFIL